MNRLRTSSQSPAPTPWVMRMAPYAPPEDPDLVAERAEIPVERLIKLDANENPYGPSPRVQDALARYTLYHRYPDPGQKMLRSLVAEYAGVSPDHVLLGNGSDELIDLICRIYLEPGDEAIDCTPTFGMYRFSTELCGGQSVEGPRTPDWRVDVDAVRAALSTRTKLIFVAMPNNPTGNREGEEVVRALVESGRIVVVDEAYVEFAGEPSFGDLVADYENLIVLRTFSKWAGLAGIRVGYGIFPPGVIRHLWQVKPPFSVNLAAEVAVRATLEDLPYLQWNVQRIVQERERMASALSGLSGVHVWPSTANFLLVEVEPMPDGSPPRSAAGLREHLAARGIAVRSYSHARLRNALRISVGLPEHTDVLAAAVRAWSETGRRP
ncbi:MAG: histidinol-phosphate transaminase [Chloroflexi bacterium]|nr:histidinol-phosphate transaminase [Chloroflexota bacterium]